jgi:membrane peptidoglycan carboxypeptidase
MAFLYGGLVTGQRWSFPGETAVSGFFGEADIPPPGASTLLIAEIQDVDGRVIYRAKPTAEPVASEQTAEMTSDILLNVVRWGTGRRAAKALPEGEGFVPLGGKTGTTNDYKNASFLGFAPGWSERGGYVAGSGLIVGSYVGYDDNRPMSSGRIRIAGASGALPAWLGALGGAHRLGTLGESEGELVDGRWPILHSHRVRRIAVDGNGLTIEAEIEADARSVLVPMPDWSGALDVTFSLEDLEAVYREALTVEEGLERQAEEGVYSTVWDELPAPPPVAELPAPPPVAELPAPPPVAELPAPPPVAEP